MVSLLEELRNDFYLFHHDYDAYRKKVDEVSSLFNLNNESKLRSDYLPTYFVGDFEDGLHKYVLFGINPGFSEKQNPKEELLKKSSLDDYLNFSRNFFTFFKDNGMKSRYYKRLSKLFSGLDGVELNDYDEIYDYYQKHVVNLDLIPYHSTSFSLSGSLSVEQKAYFERRLNSNMDFLKGLNVRLIIFNGSPFYVLLVKNGLVRYDKKVSVNKFVNMYFFELQGVPCVLFDKFLTQPAFGLSYDDLKVKIPFLIRKEFKDL